MPSCTGRPPVQVVTPAKAGVQLPGLPLDSGFRRNDEQILGSMFAAQT
jgi:hypothetical protein